jgi:hypothetical protein
MLEFHSHAACGCTGLSGRAAAAPQHRLMKWRRPMANIGFGWIILNRGEAMPAA